MIGQSLLEPTFNNQYKYLLNSLGAVKLFAFWLLLTLLWEPAKKLVHVENVCSMNECNKILMLINLCHKLM